MRNLRVLGGVVSLERQLDEWLREQLPPAPADWVGIGDDAAVLPPMRSSQVVTTDMLTDGVDFILDEVDPRLVGHKALGMNLSDLAAMAARPIAAFVSLVLPRQEVAGRSSFKLACELYRGLLTLAGLHRCTIAGGDTNTWDGPLAISVTAIGETLPRGPLLRRGARVGDVLLVTGSLGGSILGRHLRVEPRVAIALRLHEEFELHAGIDISDGLAIDAARLGEASACGVALDLDQIPIAPAAVELSKQTGRTPVEHALGDGEDFELLLAVPPDSAERILAAIDLGVPLSAVGKFVAEPGLWQLQEGGSRKPLPITGYQHEGAS